MRRVASICLALAVVGANACSSGHANSSTHMSVSAMPTDSSPEAGFVRDMSVHHAQAVAMAEAIRDRTSDAELKLLATDIALGQQNQIGRMTGWLDEWNLPIGSTQPPMAWMAASAPPAAADATAPMAGMTMSTNPAVPMPTTADGVMPGMATRPQVSALSTLPLADAEISFLRLMITHHTAGVQMAEAIVGLTARPEVLRLAQSIIDGQRGEITIMIDMLAKRGATP